MVEHFSTEQKLMAQHGYPQHAAHKKQHDDFVKTFMGAYGAFEKDGATVSLTLRWIGPCAPGYANTSRVVIRRSASSSGLAPRKPPA